MQAELDEAKKERQTRKKQRKKEDEIKNICYFPLLCQSGILREGHQLQKKKKTDLMLQR